MKLEEKYQINDIQYELGKNFLEYAVACNTDRAIPDAKSGLKPVAKRIIWSAYEQGRLPSKPHVKCARLVGETMAGYHPHGDSSIYGALVRLSQPWALRYPLIDFHGSNGNQLGDGPAASRYTEARLSKIAEEGLLMGIKKKNVDFIPNYDETAEEPVTLPSVFPNLLCNPNAGIGVSLACQWLSHNLGEVADAIYDFLDGKEPMLPGPDFPTGGIIINKNDIPSIMKTGHGSVKVRGKYNIEKNNIVFYEIPYGITVEALLSEIGEVCDNKEIEGISNIRDESNKKGIRIVIECDKTANKETIINKLFAKTKLQTSISYNQVALVDKTPTELNLKQCCEIYVEHNLDCIVREATFDFKKAQSRLHIVDGLLKALEDIDNIIALIKKSESGAKAKENLMTQYNFSEEQAKAILAMRLSSLANLEKIELQNEKASLESEIEKLDALINNVSLQKIELKTRLQDLVKKYGDARRTELAQIEEIKEKKEVVPVEAVKCMVLMTEGGLLRRVPLASYKVQKRTGKGIKNVNDIIKCTVRTDTQDSLMLFTNQGNLYRIPVSEIPETATGSKLANMKPQEEVEVIYSLQKENSAKYVLLTTKLGLMKKTELSNFVSSRKKMPGTAIISLDKNDSLASVCLINEETAIILTKNGMSLHIDTKEIQPIKAKQSRGNKAITLNPNDEVCAVLPVRNSGDSVGVFDETGCGKRVALSEFVLQKKGGKGNMVSKEDIIVGGCMLSDEDNVLIHGKKNITCISAKEIPFLNRTAKGVIVNKEGHLTSISKA